MQYCSCLTSDSNTYFVFFSSMCICIVCSISKKCMPLLLNLASPVYVYSIPKKCMGDGLEIFNATCLCFYILSIPFQRNVSCPSFSAVLFLLDTGFEFLMPAKSPLHILAGTHRTYCMRGACACAGWENMYNAHTPARHLTVTSVLVRSSAPWGSSSESIRAQ